MTSVELLATEVGRLTLTVGRIDFYRVPIQTAADFVCVPSSIVSFADAQEISVALSQQSFQGRVGRYRWRKSI